MSRWLPLFAVFLLCGCIGVRPDDDCSANAGCAARLAETALLQASHGRATRHGDVLTLHPSQTPAIRLPDDVSGCADGPAENCHRYALTAEAPVAHAFVVTNFLYEGAVTSLFDSRTGRQLSLAGTPVFSPDGERFLVAPFDLENDTGPNNLEIWRREGDGAVLEWAHLWKQEYVEDPALPLVYVTRVTRWEPDRITLALSMDGDPSKQWIGLLTQDAAGWHLSAKSPPGMFAKR